MGNIGTAMGTPIPAVGTAGTSYATQVDAFLTEAKARLEALVPRASLATGALDLANNPLQNASYVGLQAGGGGTPSTPASTLQMSGGDLYWVTNSGAAKITSGNNINTAAVNGITGDYGGGAPNAQFRYVLADSEYYAYNNFGTSAWAGVWGLRFDVAAGASSANRCRITYGGAGSYTLNLPPAAPASQKIIQMDASGNLTAAGVMNPGRMLIVGPGSTATGGGVTQTGGLPMVTVTASTTAFFPLFGAVNNQEALVTATVVNNSSGGGSITASIVSTANQVNGFAAITGASVTFVGNNDAADKVMTVTTPVVPDVPTGVQYWLKVVTPAATTFIINQIRLTVTVP